MFNFGQSLVTLLGLLVLVVAFTVLTAAFSAADAQSDPAAAEREEKLIRKTPGRIHGGYIVVFNEWATGPAGEFSRAAEMADFMTSIYGGRVRHVYSHALNGYAVEMAGEQAVALSRDPRVQLVEEDAEFSIVATQTGAPWGLDRIDQRDCPLNGTYNYNWTGSGVRVYVIDTGIRTEHTQFAVGHHRS
jgi:subtilisin family serine protease